MHNRQGGIILRLQLECFPFNLFNNVALGQARNPVGAVNLLWLMRIN
jgi:hypothetical protein